MKRLRPLLRVKIWKKLSMGALTARRQGRLARECAASAKIDLTSIMYVPNHILKIGIAESGSKE